MLSPFWRSSQKSSLGDAPMSSGKLDDCGICCVNTWLGVACCCDVIISGGWGESSKSDFLTDLGVARMNERLKDSCSLTVSSGATPGVRFTPDRSKAVLTLTGKESRSGGDSWTYEVLSNLGVMLMSDQLRSAWEDGTVEFSSKIGLGVATPDWESSRIVSKRRPDLFSLIGFVKVASKRQKKNDKTRTALNCNLKGSRIV